MAYETCDICGCNTLIPWSELFRDEFEIPTGTVICTEGCYYEGKASDEAAEAEYRVDSLMDR